MAQRRPDAQFAGAVLRSYVKARFGGAYKMADRGVDYPAATFYAVTSGTRYAVDHDLVHGLELALGLPVGTFELLALQDFDAITDPTLLTLARKAAGVRAAAAGERRRAKRTG